MKRFILLAVSLVFCLSMLAACGGESVKSYDFTGFAGESISVGAVVDCGYKVDHKGQYKILILKDDDSATQIMEGYLDADNVWTDAAAKMDGGSVEVIAQEDEKLIYKDGDTYTAVFMVPGALSYVVLEGTVGGDVTDEDITTALDNIRITQNVTE